MTRPTAVIVEDEAFLALDLQEMCEEAGFDILASAASERQARKRFCALAPDVLIADMELIDGSRGTRVASWMRTRQPHLRVIFVTGTSDPELLEEIQSVHPDAVFSKPVPEARFTGTLSRFRSPGGQVVSMY